MPSVEVTVPARAASVGVARRLLLDSLEAWDLQGLEYDASVVLSELVTNSVLHAGTEVTIRLSCEGGVLRMEVTDGSQRMPTVRHRSARATTGRGLLLVHALASSWGTSETDDGKVVWAEFADTEAGGGVRSEPTELRPMAGAGEATGSAVAARNRAGAGDSDPAVSLKRPA